MRKAGLGSGDLVAQLGYHTEVSPVLLMCFIKIVKNYFSREENEKLLLKIQELPDNAKSIKPNFSLDFIFEEMERELEKRAELIMIIMIGNF